MKAKGVIRIVAVAMLAGVAIPLLFAACGHRRGQVVQLTPMLSEQQVQDSSEQTGDTGSGVLPGVLALDALAAGACRSVSNGTQVMSFGADYSPELSGTTSDREYSIESSGTSLKLRAYAPGDYAFALYGQEIDGSPKPLQTLIDSEVCEFGGGQDDDIPLVYYLGFADYSVGSWRWFGPFGDVDVVVEVNSAALKSRFKSPNDNFYICVMTTNPGRAASSLPVDGLVAPVPFEPMMRAVSEDELDPGGVTIEAVITDTEEGLDTEPAVVTGLAAVTDAGGVTLTWDVNLDPDVFMYQVFRDDRDDEDAKVLIKGIAAPDVEYRDETGAPGKQYEYSVRALKLGDLEGGGFAAVSAARSLYVLVVCASDGAYSDFVRVVWGEAKHGLEVEGAVGYQLFRTDSAEDEPQPTDMPLAVFGVDEFGYDDYDCVLEQIYYYWARALGEDIDGPMGGPDSGFCIELEPVQVTATDGDWPYKVELVWGELDEPLLMQYNIYRDTDEEEAGAELLDWVYPPEHEFTDYGAPWNEPRFYFVKPVVGDEQPRGVGDWGHRGLAVPANVMATQGTDAMKVTVSWDAGNYASRYKLFRAINPDDPDPTEVGEVEAMLTTLNDAPDGWSGTEGVHYYYFVAALHGGPDTERSDLSAPAEGWRGIAAPATVTATNGTLGDRVAISWSAVSQATVYQVYRDESPIGVPIEAPTTTYDDYDTAFNAYHDYSVSAGIALGYGPESASDEGWRGLLAPVNVQASDGEYVDKIAVTWGMVNTATGYRIYRSETDDDPSPPLLDSVTGGTTTSYDDTSAVPNVQYWYSVSAWITIQLNEGPRSADDVGTIGNKSPVASLSADPTEGDAPLTVNFDASDSYDEDGEIVKYEWDWTNDGTYDHDSGTDPTVEHEYTSAGEYTCKLRVTDDDGAMDTDILVVKAIGTVWVHTWGGSDKELVGRPIVSSTGEVFVAGHASSYGAGNRDVLVIKYHPDGSLAWVKTWGGSAEDYATQGIVDANGDFIVVGLTESFGAGGDDDVLLKYSAAGDLLWQKTWGGAGDEALSFVDLDASGNIYVSGRTNTFGAGGWDAVIRKYSPSGNLLWARTWGGSATEYSTHILAVEQNIYLLGYTSSYGAGGYDTFLIKFDAEGNRQWVKTWGGSSSDCAESVYIDANGDLIVIGSTYSYGSGSDDVFILKFDSSGNLQFQKTWGSTQRDQGWDITVDDSNNIFVSGGTMGFSSDWDAILLMLDSSGNVNRQAIWHTSGSVTAFGIFRDANGTVYIGGKAPNAYGSWQNVSGGTPSPSGSVGSPEGTQTTPSGTETTPDGSESSPEGVQDTGGGGDDVLIMKYYPG